MKAQAGLIILGIVLIGIIIIGVIFFITGIGNPESTTSNRKVIQETPLIIIDDSDDKIQKITTTQQFTIDADDDAFYIDKKSISSISVNKGNNIKILFKVKSDNVYFGGLKFKGNSINTGKVSPGDSTTFEFTADNDFEIKSYWPSSNRLKDTLKVNVIN